MESSIQHSISDELFKLKQESSQIGYLCFTLGSANYAINIQNILHIVDTPALVYLSHLSPPIVGMHYYEQRFIPALDFAGYRPHTNLLKLLILSSNIFRKNNPFGLVIDNVHELQYFKIKDLIENPYPFNNLLPSYYYTDFKERQLHFIEVQDIENQIE
jgi:chemotaxis signal transduction protein